MLRRFIKRALLHEANENNNNEPEKNKKTQYRIRLHALYEKLNKYTGQYALAYADTEDPNDDNVEEMDEDRFVRRTQLIRYNLPQYSSSNHSPLFYEDKSGKVRNGVFIEHDSMSKYHYLTNVLYDSMDTNDRHFKHYLENNKEKHDIFDFVIILLYEHLSPDSITQQVFPGVLDNKYFILPFNMLERAIDVCSTLSQLYIMCERLEEKLFQ